MSPTAQPTPVYCPGCNHEVRLTITKAPRHRGHANLPDGAQVVCLDFGDGCGEGRCALTGSPGIVMAVRLARSHLADDHFETLTARCDACGNVSDLEILDERYAFCPICESTTRWMVLDVDRESRVAVTVK